MDDFEKKFGWAFAGGESQKRLPIAQKAADRMRGRLLAGAAMPVQLIHWDDGDLSGWEGYRIAAKWGWDGL